MHARTRTGFTLVEVVLAALLVGIIFLAVQAVLATAVDTHRASRQEARLRGDLDVITELLTRDCQRLQAQLPGGEAVLRGFTGGDDPGPRLILRVEEPLVRGGRQLRVDYFLMPGDTDALRLIRRREEVPVTPSDSRAAAAQPTTRYEVLADGIAAFSLRYFGEEGWSETWDSAAAGAPPRLVEFTLRLAEGGRETTHRRVAAVLTERALLDPPVEVRP